MGLGNRNARRHETAKTAGVNPSDYWDFAPGQTVMTVDGFLGKVTAVDDGPLAGTETYEVTLSNGLGGGQYTASQLRASNDHSAAANTAALDYPELAEVLVERPDPGKSAGRSFSMHASRQVEAVSGPMEGESKACVQCAVHGVFSSQETVGKCDFCGQDKDIYRYRGGAYEKQPESLCLDCIDQGNHMDSAHEREHADVDTVEHLARRPRDEGGFTPTWKKTSSLQAEGAYFTVEEMRAVGQAAVDADPEGRSAAEILRAQADLLPGQTSNEGGAPGVCDNGHLTWGGVCPACRDTEPSQNAMVVNEGDNKPNPQVTAGAHAWDTADDVSFQYHAENPPKGDGCTTCGDSDHETESHVDEALGPRRASIEETIERGYAMVRQAMANPDFGFHVVATWADVRRKAKRIRAEGGVHITSSEGNMVVAHVLGENDTYESVILRAPGSQKVAQWDCACEWSKYHWGAPDDFSRFAGRMCSHVLALNFEAQSRGMFGKDVGADAGAPAWLRKSQQGLTASLDIPDCGPLHVFAALALSQGEDRDELAFLLSRVASVSSPLGEPSGNYSPPQPGPTMTPNPSENPASAGFLTSPDPSTWDQQGPSTGGVGATISSLDEAVFEPEIVTQASLAPVLSGPAALIAPLVRTLGPMVLNRAVQHHEDGEEAEPSSGGGEIGPKKVNEFAHHLKSWTDQSKNEGDAVRNSMTGSLESTLHDEPEPALPSTDGSEGDLDEGQTWSGYAGDPDPDPVQHRAVADQSTCSHAYPHNLHGQCTNCGRIEPTEGDEPCDHEWCVKNEAPHSKDEHDMAPPAHLDPYSDASREAEQSMRDAFGGDEDHSWLLDHQHQGPSKFSSVSTGVEYAVPGDVGSPGAGPGTNFKTDPTSLEPEDPSFVSTGSVADIVAEFQRTAGAANLEGGSGPAPMQAQNRDTSDIAAAAQAYLTQGEQGLEKVAMAVFTPGEQKQLIEEGEGTVRAANLDRLEITGTHYEALDALDTNTDDEDTWLS